MSKLNDLGKTIADIDLGGFDAESDHKLTDHFINTPIIDRILDGNKYLILGRKGSGKSALFREIPRISAERGGPEVIKLTPNAYSWSTLRNYREQGLSIEHAHSGAWKLSLAIEMAAHLTRSDIKWHDKVRPHATTLRSFIDSNFGKGQELDIPGSIYKGIESFDLSALGFSVGLTRGKRGEAKKLPATPAVTDAVINNLVPLLAAHPCIVELDRIDDAWEGGVEDRSLVVGLLKAVKDLNDSFNGAGVRAKIIVFLRTDIYNALQFDDSDKHRQGEQQISWNQESLRQVVSARLPVDLEIDDLFEPGMMRGKSKPFDHMLRRTFLRPREVLQFVHLVLETEGEESTQVLKSRSLRANSSSALGKCTISSRNMSRPYRSFLL